MNRTLPVLMLAISASFSTAFGQGRIAAGTILPLPPSASSQIASGFMFEVRDSQWADSAERQIADAVGRFDGNSVAQRVHCKETICRASVRVPNADESAIWRVDSKSVAAPWAQIPYRELAEAAGFERVTEHFRSIHDDGGGTVYLFFSGNEDLPG